MTKTLRNVARLSNEDGFVNMSRQQSQNISTMLFTKKLQYLENLYQHPCQYECQHETKPTRRPRRTIELLSINMDEL